MMSKIFKTKSSEILVEKITQTLCEIGYEDVIIMAMGHRDDAGAISVHGMGNSSINMVYWLDRLKHEILSGNLDVKKRFNKNGIK